MTTKKKVARAGTQTASDNALHTRIFRAIRSAINATIVRLGVWGVIPSNLASWLIQRGGLRDE